jgi:hypothetical protein
VIAYLFEGTRRRFTIGILDKQGAAGESISSWLDNGRLTLAQARAIAGQWKADRHAGRDLMAEREACLAALRIAEEAQRDAAAREAAQPTVREVVEHFAAKHLAGKKGGPAMRHRLDRLAYEIGTCKLRDLKRKDVIDALERIAEGQIKGRTAKHLAGEVLVQAKRLWRFAAAREWIDASCIDVLTRAGIDARPVRRNVVLRLDEVAELWRALGDSTRCKSDEITAGSTFVAQQQSRHQSGFAENVSQSFGRPESMPRLNQRTRCSDEPCVNDSGTMRPCVCFCKRSSPIAVAALRASAMSPDSS